MFEAKPLSSSGSKRDFYASLAQQLTGLLEGEPDAIANAANMSALIYQLMPDLNWAGFYFMRGPGLVLGPFQGKVACVRIPVGRGVCGSAVDRKESIVVPDVHAFPGHIACDGRSASEIVVPVYGPDGALLAVLDVDSERVAAFDDDDRSGLERIVGWFAGAAGAAAAFASASTSAPHAASSG